MNLVSRALTTAFRWAPRLPEPTVRAAADAAAFATWLARGSGVQQLEKNLATIRPQAASHTRSGSRRALRNYFRYYAEALYLPALTPALIDARVVVNPPAELREHLQEKSAIVVLGHLGNWDLAGAWASRHLAPVLTVAEHLQPEELFHEFVRLREDVGMSIIPLDDGNVFRQLISRSRQQRHLVCLLADRDLTRSGMPATITDQPARVAAGPAALAAVTGMPLYFVGSRHIRLAGERARRAGTRWGMALEFFGPLTTSARGEDAVADLTTQWTGLLSDYLRAHPLHWHMLQPVFDADLDLARIREKQGA